MTRYLIEIYPRWTWLGRKRWHFRIRHSNGQIVANGDSSGYYNHADCETTARNLRDGLGSAKIEEVRS